MPHTLTITDIQDVTHDVRRYRFEKPEGYSFTPGQATEVAIDKDGWRDEKRPFTFTSLNSDPYLEFVIKSYPDHNGVTEQIGRLETGDALIIDDPWGTIEYKGEGVFIAGGAGVTPFIAIFRDLDKKGKLGENRLIFSNKTDQDVILEKEFEDMLGDHFISVITDEPTDDHLFLDGFIDKPFLDDKIDDFSQPFYVCGPQPFNKAMMGYLKELGADPDALVFEE
ncbi:FAD-binding oxidoreductase [Rhodohalobacter mucosus]|uniref:Flavodoxin reductase n=1 Tax=Rhodohalobacter mucosus TaxID=2079485 RepID=A0A316TUA0_9BACT|nr:FAD-binding oxidoreductase [Rhodohalobacter mucosus]PWN05882.1 flavodoxin reductase [Rhodohalobacter mucosus]